MLLVNRAVLALENSVLVGWTELDEGIPAAVGPGLAGGDIETMAGAVPVVVLGVLSGPVGIAVAGTLAGSRADLRGGGIEVVLGALSSSVKLVVS